MNEQRDPSPAATAGSANWYLTVVGGLLILICSSLAVLWLMERTRRIRAERELLILQETHKLQQLLQVSPPPKLPHDPERVP